MKKLLSIAAVAALLVTGLNAGDITLEATVDPAATVQLGAAFTESDLTSGEGVFNAYSMSERVTLPLGAETTLVDLPLYLQSNGEASGVLMSLAFATMAGVTDSDQTIEVKCYYDAAANLDDATVATTPVSTGSDTSITAVEGQNDGAKSAGQLKVTGTTLANQVAQNYDGTVTVTITPA